MRKTQSLFVCFLLFVSFQTLLSQTWQTFTNVPTISRYNDVFFVTPARGWIVNGSGQIHRTTNGGLSWQKQFEQAITHFRSIGFIDSLHGWAGNVGPGEFGATDTTALYQTNNGGQTWTPMPAFQGPKPRGLCGMHVVNDSVICAVGRVRGPAFFTKTTDRGQTWYAKDMSAYAAGLIDVYFFHPDTGIAVGLTNVDHNSSRGVVLYTTDGGETWEKRLTTARTGEWCWKVSFPSRRVGYASLQRNNETPIYFLKTTDGGITWQEKLFSNSYYFVQGIGFVDEQNGWIGGNNSNPTYKTTNGGETWQSAVFGGRVNRIRFLGDTLGYAVGNTVYKYTAKATHVTQRPQETPSNFLLAQNYPNPFNPSTTIRFTLSQPALVNIMVYDINGREVERLLDQPRAAGEHTITWDAIDREGNAAPSGVYWYTIRTEHFTGAKKMVLVR